MPEYTVNAGDIMIMFTGPEDRIVRMPGRLSDKLSDKVNEKVNEGVNVHVNDRQKRIVILSCSRSGIYSIAIIGNDERIGYKYLVHEHYQTRKDTLKKVISKQDPSK